MNQQIEQSTNGEKGNHLLQIRLTKSQHDRLRALAISSGFNTISSYTRNILFSPSIEMKLNSILSLLQNNKNKLNVTGEKTNDK